jgi:hypothetical protein
MNKLTIQQYNDIKKEAIVNYIKTVEGYFWSRNDLDGITHYHPLLQQISQEVFKKLDKRQQKQKRRGSEFVVLLEQTEDNL